MLILWNFHLSPNSHKTIIYWAPITCTFISKYLILYISLPLSTSPVNGGQFVNNQRNLFNPYNWYGLEWDATCQGPRSFCLDSQCNRFHVKAKITAVAPAIAYAFQLARRKREEKVCFFLLRTFLGSCGHQSCFYPTGHPRCKEG